MTEDVEERLAELESLVKRQQATIDAYRRELAAPADTDGPDSVAAERWADDPDFDGAGVGRWSDERSFTASDGYKVLGDLDDADGAGVLGKNTADSGTPVGVEGSVPNASGFGLSTPDDANVGGALRTTQLRNAVGEAQLQAAFDGLVVPVAPGLGMDDAVDPKASSTPVQDAIDAIDSTGWWTSEFSGGAVLLPAGRIEEAGPLTSTVFKSFIGRGTHATELQFPNLQEPAIKQASLPGSIGDGAVSYWDGVRFYGVDGRNRSGAAIYFDKPGVRYFNVGRLVFTEWNDVVYLDEECPFECYWDSFGAVDGIYGRSIVADNASLGSSSWVIDKLNLYRDDGAGRVIDGRTAGSGNFEVRDLHIQINGDTNGESGPPPIEVDESSFGRFRIDNVHYETAVGLDLPAIIRLSGGSKYQLDMVDALGPNDDKDMTLVLDNVVQLQDVGQAEIGQHVRNPASTTIEGSWLRVDGSPLDGAVLFHGESSQVTETGGSTAGKIWALEDMRVIDPFHRERVTHTTGGPTVVDGINQGQVGGSRAELERVTPRVQRLDPVAMPDADFSVDHRFEWRGSGDYERWVLVLDWAVDPGVDVEFDLEVTTRGPG